MLDRAHNANHVLGAISLAVRCSPDARIEFFSIPTFHTSAYARTSVLGLQYDVRRSKRCVTRYVQLMSYCNTALTLLHFYIKF